MRDWKPSRYEIRSHRSLVGPLIVGYKRAWQKVLGPLLDSILEVERENLFAAVTDRVDALLQALDRRQAALEAEILALNERMRRFERDGTLVDELRLTNAAILESRERLGEMRGEIERLIGTLPSSRAARANGMAAEPQPRG